MEAARVAEGLTVKQAMKLLGLSRSSYYRQVRGMKDYRARGRQAVSAHHKERQRLKAPEKINQVLLAGFSCSEILGQDRTMEALQYIQTHKPEVTDIAAKWVGRDRETVGREINGYWSAYSSDGTMSDDVLRETINIGLQRAKLEKTIPISQVADTSILNEVKREMGIR